MNETEALEAIGKMSIEEKLSMLSETDKAYVRGFVDRVVVDVHSRMKKGEAAMTDD